MKFYDIASKYRAIGWSIIPLYNYQKNPFPIAWKTYQTRLCTDEEFEAWFTDSEVTGLGLITGKLSGVVVLDEDAYKPGGIRVKIETGMLAKTARDGRHHYFKYVEPIRSSGFREGIHVEIKADGGFVVLPPSQVKIEDKLMDYEWLEKCHPDDLLEITEDQLAPYRGEKGTRVNLSELTGASEGVRHLSLLQMADSVFNRFRREEWGLAEDIVRYEAGKCIPPHPESDVETIIRDAKRFVLEHPNREREEVKSSIPSSMSEIIETRIADRALERMAPKTGWVELDRLIKGFVPGHVYTMTGTTNVGKTTVACNFANALCHQRKRTLYIALEPGTMLVEYLASIRLNKRFPDITDDDLRKLANEEYIDVFLQNNVREVKDLIRVLQANPIRYDLVIIDHIGYFVRSERDWLQQQSNVVKELAFLAKERKTAIMLIAHLRKPGTTRQTENWHPTQDDISGSAAFKQDSTDVLLVHRPTTSDDQYSVQFQDIGTLIVAKTKSGPNGNLGLVFSRQSAKIYSTEEAQENANAISELTSQEQERYEQNMLKTFRWKSDDVNTGNDSTT